MRWEAAVGIVLVTSAFLTASASADAPISLASAVPAKPTGPTKRVVMPSAPASAVTAMTWPAYGQSSVAVCTTFPGTVSIDRAGNVFKQPVEINAQGHECTVGAPAALVAPQKTVGGVTETRPN